MKTKTENPLPKTLPGTDCAQMVKCGKPTCKCARGELHGPYYYHFVRQDRVLVKRYIRATAVEQTRSACADWRFREKHRREASKISVRRLIKLLNLLKESEAQLAGIRKRNSNG